MKLHSGVRNSDPNIIGDWISEDRDFEAYRQELFWIYALGRFVGKDGIISFKYQSTLLSRLEPAPQ
jgi:hypothetical protein